MTGLVYMTKEAKPYEVIRDTSQAILDHADSVGALWVVVNGVLVGKTIMGTWAKV